MKSSIHYDFLDNEIKRFFAGYCRINGKMLNRMQVWFIGGMWGWINLEKVAKMGN